MGRKSHLAALLIIFAVGAAVRLNNAFTFPSLRAFDGFGHFTYIWFMAEHWRTPSPIAGWSFFHPPLYYWLMATIWTRLGSVDPVTRLNVGTALVAVLGLTQAVVSYTITRRFLPERPLVALLAAGLMLFLPVHLYTAGFLGNENLDAVLCALSLAALLWVLHRPTWITAGVLGLCLGAAMLTKFTALAVVAGALATIALRTWLRKSWKEGFVTLTVTVCAMLSVCGWFYARNLIEYGTPFKLSRDEFMVRRVEDFQSRGERGLLEYVLFDPLILRRPQWPRGVMMTGDQPPEVHSSLRESVLTGVYANAWFDAVGGIVIPAVTVSETSRRSGQLLLTLGLVPSILVVVGLWTAIKRLWREGWDDTLAAMLLTFGAMVTIFVQATRAVPLNAAVKATYMLPVSVVFAFWFALGADHLGRFSERWLRWAAVVCAAVAITSVVVFSNGVFIARDYMKESVAKSDFWQNLYGVVYYAAGQRDRALELFEFAASKNWHLGYENLASMALEDGRALEALYYLRSAAVYQPRQSFGTPYDRARYERTTQAEYLNKMAVIYDRLGWNDLALQAARKAFEYDPTILEAGYDLAVLTLAGTLTGDAARTDPGAQAAIARSRRLILDTVVADPAYFEARALGGAIDVLEGDCDGGFETIRNALAPHPDEYRQYPLSTGLGDIHAAAIKRRIQIEELPSALRPKHPPSRCAVQRH